MLHYFADNLRRIRREQEISQPELARRANLPQTYISALERGLRPRDLTHVGTLAAALGVTEDALLRRHRRRRVAVPAADGAETPSR